MAEELSGLRFSVYVGPSDGESRPYAERLHAQLDGAPHSVLFFVDPGGCRLEIVTGTASAQVLDDSACGLVALTMQTDFAAGDLVGGITNGLQQLGQQARRPTTLHTETR